MTMTAERLFGVAQATIKAAEFYFLITLSESGQPNARLMQHVVIFSNLDVNLKR